MNSNKISCQKYISSNSLFEFISYLGVVSQICISDLPENNNTPQDGAYLTDFVIDFSMYLSSPTALAFGDGSSKIIGRNRLHRVCKLLMEMTLLLHTDIGKYIQN